MKHRLDFVAVAHADEVAEVVLHHGQVVDVVPDVGREHLLVALADDLLLGLVGRPPIDVERDLVGFDQGALSRIWAIEEEVHVAPSTRLVRLKRGIDDL